MVLVIAVLNSVNRLNVRISDETESSWLFGKLVTDNGDVFDFAVDNEVVCELFYSQVLG